MSKFILENRNIRLEFDGENGAVTGITAIQSGWEILNRPQLGLSFKLLVPLKGRRNNPVLGEKQKVDFLEIGQDNKSIVFIWNKVQSEFGGIHDIKLILRVDLTDNQVKFTMEIENKSEYTIENVYCPYFGDIHRPKEAQWFKTFTKGYATPNEDSLWPEFTNGKGYWGVDFPTNFLGKTPTHPFVLIRSETQGLYVGVGSQSYELVAWQTELLPGLTSSIDYKVPIEDTIGGKDVATRFAAVHIPYILPGEVRKLTPIVLEAFDGDWQKGVDIYKKWRKNTIKTSKIPQWVLEPHSWQQIHINSPEDEFRMRYKDLVKIGESCVNHGVKAIQLVGWNNGGQDRGNPSHDHDPMLGTFQELKEAVAKIKQMGVKVILFVKFTWSDRSTEQFRNNLHRLAVKDPYGDYYLHEGYQYQTATQLMDINTKRLVPMCFLSEEYLEVCEEEFKKCVELEPDGILYDECQHHNPAVLCFDKSHGHRYGAPVYANDNKLVIENFSNMTIDDKDFLFAGEALYDWEFEAYHLLYHRTESSGHKPLTRYILPDMPMMTAVVGFNDRNMINQCLMYKYIISYEPYYFKGALEDFPLTIDYGKKMDALRTELRDYFWDGEFRDTCGVKVINNKGNLHKQYGVFINRKTGNAGVVVCNFDLEKSVYVKVVFEDDRILSKYRLVDETDWHNLREEIEIPAKSAVVLV